MCIKRLLGCVKLVLLGAVIFSIQPVLAGVLNQDVILDANGWSDISISGSVGVNDGAAKFSGGPGGNPFSAGLVLGDDGSFSFANPIKLDADVLRFEFDLWQSAKSVDITETGDSIFADAFTLAIYDAQDPAFDLIYAGLAFTPAIVRHSLDISSLAGRNVAFSFEMADENDGFNLAVVVDNLRIVPESSALVLFFVSLSLLVLIRKYRNDGRSLVRL